MTNENRGRTETRVVSRTLLDNTGSVEMPTETNKVVSTNPATSFEQKAEVETQRRRRIPMSVPTRKLETPDLPGFHLHWISGEPDRVARASNAGYDFVQEHELPGYRVGFGDEAGIQGNSDLGTRISVVAGGTGSDNQAARLYLMKLPQEYYEEDMAARDAEGQKVVDALRTNPNAQQGDPRNAGGDASNRYIPDMGQNRGAKRQASQSYNVFSTLKR